MANDTEADIVARAAIMILKESLVTNYQLLQELQGTNATIDNDYAEFMRVYEEIATSTPPQQFSLGMVYKKLPNNSWGSIYQQIMRHEQKRSTYSEPPDMEELKNNTLFQAYCAVARHGAH